MMGGGEGGEEGGCRVRGCSERYILECELLFHHRFSYFVEVRTNERKSTQVSRGEVTPML